MTEPAPVRAARYARISLDKAGDEHGVTNQLADQQRTADARGMLITHTFTDNDIGALTGKYRPGYEALMEAVKRGEIDVILVYQTSRIWRNRSERAHGIEILRKHRMSVIATKGPSLDFSTAYGRAMAGLLGEFDTMESEVKAERQELAARQRADNGQPPLGVRLTGYTTSGEVIEHEAAIVRQAFARFHGGDSLRGIATWLTDYGVPTRRGRPWNPSSVRTMLTNPRYAGRSYYNRKENGTTGSWSPAKWPPLVEDWIYDLVQARLADPRRRKQVGTYRKHLGSGLYRCGVCGKAVRAHTAGIPGGGPSQLRYRCPDGHVNRTAAPVDALILLALRDLVASPGFARAMAEPDTAEAREIAAEIGHLNGRLRRAELDYDADLIDAARYKAKAAKIRAELEDAEARQARLAAPHATGMLLAADPVAAFDAASLGIKRALLDQVMTVRLAHTKRGHHFDPASVQVEWKRG